MNASLESFVDDLNHFESYDADERSACLQRAWWIDSAASEDLVDLLSSLAEFASAASGVPSNSFVTGALTRLLNRVANDPSINSDAAIAESLRERMCKVYRELGPQCECRHLPLMTLISLGGSQNAAAFVELIVADPPTQGTSIVQAFTPLFRRRDLDVEALFPRLLDGIAHVELAAPIIDLANFLTREEIVSTHPATNRAEELGSLLGQISRRLGHYEENVDLEVESAEKMSEKVSEAVTLAVSICDALALIGDTSVVDKIHQALEPSHRRLRTEAAAALAKLGEEKGKQELAALAKEPVARLRVLAYADELGLADMIDESYTTSEARAEAKLSLHLAQPTQLGFPPTNCELIDQCWQYWPGYDDEVECFLFRFNYELGPSHYSNVGIVGPVTHALTSDLADLPPKDIYAVFAGWQAEHEEIYELDVEGLDETGRRDVERLERRLVHESYQKLRPIVLGFFFGDKVLVAEASRDGQSGLAVVDQEDIFWYSTENRLRPLGPPEVYWLYKGRKLLGSFNPE